jgi:hypothetical protein
MKDLDFPADTVKETLFFREVKISQRDENKEHEKRQLKYQKEREKALETLVENGIVELVEITTTKRYTDIS